LNNLLIKKWIKDSENVTSSEVRKKYGELSGSVGIILNVILSLGKFIVGILFSGISVMADAVNNLTDAGSSVVTLVGFRLSSRPADREHPFGHERIEYITGLIISFIILMLGIELIKSSIEKIITPEPLQFSISTVIILVVSILVKLWMYQFNRKLGKKISSDALLATAADSLSDVVATGAVLISLLISYFTSWNLDGYMGVLVALMIMWTGIGVMRKTLNSLLGEAPDGKLVETIEEMVLKNEKVIGIHDLIVHNYGPNRFFASVHAEVSASEDILESHDAIDNIEREALEKYDIILTIHLDPIETDNEVVNELRCFTAEAVRAVDERLSMHDFRVVIGQTHSNLIFDVAMPLQFDRTEEQVAKAIEAKIKEHDPKLNAVMRIDSSYTTTEFGKKEN
jgi:cation diffusion facilitator family transporter